MATILPFVRPVRPAPPAEPLAYAPGVTPFDRTNPAHIRAWNAMFAFGRAKQPGRDQ